MPWNYRVTMQRREARGGYVIYGIREVYYREDGSVLGWTEDIVDLSGESPEDIKTDLELMRGAFDHPVLDITDDPVEVTDAAQ